MSKNNIDTCEGGHLTRDVGQLRKHEIGGHLTRDVGQLRKYESGHVGFFLTHDPTNASTLPMKSDSN